MSQDKNPYLTVYKGRFKGVLKWEQLDELFDRVRELADRHWFIYAVGEQPPEESVSAEQLDHFLTEINQLLRREHEERYCGIVYADDFEQPCFIKIFDPNNLGVSCGFSEHPPLPGWVLSTLKPVDLPAAFPPPGNRRRWWQALFS
jgi:hypothetical protein